jgi:hypothetical protein
MEATILEIVKVRTSFIMETVASVSTGIICRITTVCHVRLTVCGMGTTANVILDIMPQMEIVYTVRLSTVRRTQSTTV